MYGRYSDKDLNEWEKFNAILLTSSAFGAWLMRRDEKRDKCKLEQAKAELALEQEPFMNKPCVAHQVCHEDKVKVLDKIKAEIDAHRKTIRNMADIDDWYAGRLGGHDCDIEIIDKYRAESEETCQE